MYGFYPTLSSSPIQPIPIMITIALFKEILCVIGVLLSLALLLIPFDEFIPCVIARIIGAVGMSIIFDTGWISRLAWVWVVLSVLFRVGRYGYHAVCEFFIAHSRNKKANG